MPAWRRAELDAARSVSGVPRQQDVGGRVSPGEPRLRPAPAEGANRGLDELIAEYGQVPRPGFSKAIAKAWPSRETTAAWCAATGSKKRNGGHPFRGRRRNLFRIWCGEGDLNPHALSSASTSS